MLGEIYIWKRMPSWVGGSWPYQAPAVQHGTMADGLSHLHPIGLGSVPVRGRALSSHIPVLCHPAPLTPLASMSQPAAMGGEVGWLSKPGVRRGMALPRLGKYWLRQKAGEML